MNNRNRKIRKLQKISFFICVALFMVTSGPNAAIVIFLVMLILDAVFDLVKSSGGVMVAAVVAATVAMVALIAVKVRATAVVTAVVAVTAVANSAMLYGFVMNRL